MASIRHPIMPGFHPDSSICRVGAGFHRVASRLFRALALALVAAAPALRAVELERFISREDPKFDCAKAAMTVGRDGNVYLASNANPGYVLRVSPDGGERLGGEVVYALQNATANADGIIATANAHFSHSVNLYDAGFQHLATGNEFLVNDGVGWDAPARVEAGAGGDFYGLDQHRLRLLRLNPAGRIVQVYAFPAEAKAWDFRVCEKSQTFYLRGRDGTIHFVGFDGVLRRSHPLPGALVWTVDEAGTLLAMSTAASIVKRWTATGEALPDIHLQTGELGPTARAPATGIGVAGDHLILKRAHPTELFQVYDLADGRRKTVAATAHESLRAACPGLLWTAGRPLPFRVDFNGPGAPRWRVWAATYGDTDWRELDWDGDQLEVPADFAGLYQIRIAPTLNPTAASEYRLREVVEVRQPDSLGTVSVWTPDNRIWFGRGEAIPVTVALRTSQTDAPANALLTLRRQPTDATRPPPLWSAALSFVRDEQTGEWRATATVPAAVVAPLAAGRYRLAAALLGYTCAAQPIRLGPGMGGASPFRVTLHGDYRNFNSTADAWDFADAADELLLRSHALGVNQYVNRIFAGRYPLAFANTPDGVGVLRGLAGRLAADPNGVAPGKVAFGFPHGHALGAFGAHGWREWLLLVGMDAALPIGTSTSYAAGMKPEQYAAEIKKYSEALRPLPAFQGWTWVANWWVTNPSLRFASPDQKAAYEAALKKADESGEWSPILDAVGDRAVGWQVEAQQAFGEALAAVDSRFATASAGPYRRPEVYPPVSFANVDEVDLHFQAEQVTCPNWTAHAADFYRRPGKPAWIHPELFNDAGTGEQILPMSWLAIMRGVDGIGTATGIPNWGVLPTDARSGYAGTASVFRALNRFARQYGPWLTTLANHDAIAIPVSYRQIKVDAWGGIGGRTFTRLWEAYVTCLYARRPATFVFAEDQPDLRRFTALLLVGQRYQPEPALATLLAQARKQGLPIFADGTCRESLAAGCQPLGVAFDRIEKLHGFNNDAAYWDFAETLLDQAPNVAAALAAVVPPVGDCDQPEVLLSERRHGEARFVWVVNNTFTPLAPGQLWRVQNAVATHAPVVAKVALPVKRGEVVYDVFEQREVSGVRVQGSGTTESSNIQRPTFNTQRPTRDESSLKPDTRNLKPFEFIADLRFSHARLYAVLPRAIAKLDLDLPRKLIAGQTFEWTATVPGIKAKLPLHVTLRDGTGALLEERYTTTGTGTLTVPINAILPVTVSANELISGKTSGARRQVSGVGKDSIPEPRNLKPEPLFGPRLRDLAISRDGTTALLNAFAWGENLHALDLATGKLRWSGNVGDHFAYAPVATADGFAVQGYDLGTGEGYHLYQLAGAGAVQRRFALPGLPARLTNWAFAPHLNDRINNFANSADGAWIAAAGNLALAVWSTDGALLWSQDWSSSSRETRQLLALDAATLVVARGMTLAACEARTGRVLWEVTLAPAGDIEGLAASADGTTIAARTTLQSGRVFVVRDGKQLATLPTAATAVALPPDGSLVAVTTGKQLQCHAATGGLQWLFQADDTLRFPRISPDGKRLAVGSELGTLYVVDLASGDLRSLDLGALPVAAWLADGDLVAATWLGTAVRFDDNLKEKWRTCLTDAPSILHPQPSSIPTIRLDSWSTAESAPLPLTANLVAPTAVIVRAMLGERPIELQNPAATLFDGQTTAPAKPWVSWKDLGMIDSGWRGSFSLEIDTFRTQLRVDAITFVDDPAHPEAWLRDTRLEYWDAAAAAWVFAQYLTADAAIHTHRLAKPIEASRFRLARPDGPGWPAGNLRLAEIVLHGETLGVSHPDVIRNLPVAVLFDEDKSALQCLVTGHNPHFEFRTGQAASGALFMALKAEGAAIPSHVPGFGHAVPNWNFDLVENPETPGQYRWFQFAYRTLGAETRGVTVLLGNLAIDLGEPVPLAEGVGNRRRMAEQPASEWTTVRLDLWQIWQDGAKDGKPRSENPPAIRAIRFHSLGGGAAFDRLLLGRTEADLKAVSP